MDFYKDDYEEQVTLILDTKSGQALVAVSGFYNDQTSRRTRTYFNNAYIEGNAPTTPYQATEDLIGKHIRYQYTKSDAYEHVYFNQGTFAWHCLGGTEQGMADVEPCKMLKLGEKLYMLFWTEKIMPVESVVVIDLQHMRSTGRFLCWDPKPNTAVRTLFGSHATVLADTKAVNINAKR